MAGKKSMADGKITPFAMKIIATTLTDTWCRCMSTEVTMPIGTIIEKRFLRCRRLQ
jgi:hypothetical protein